MDGRSVRAERVNCWMRICVPIVSICAIGGCPRPEDRFEPNDTPDTATLLTLGQPLEGRVVQGDPDIFAVDVANPGTLRLTLDSRGEEEEKCAAFRLTAPDEMVLYDDNARSCSRGLDEPTKVPGAGLTYTAGAGYVLIAPADAAGTYLLKIVELGHADNIFDYSWSYRLTASVE